MAGRRPRAQSPISRTLLLLALACSLPALTTAQRIYFRDAPECLAAKRSLDALQAESVCGSQIVASVLSRDVNPPHTPLDAADVATACAMPCFSEFEGPLRAMAVNKCLLDGNMQRQLELDASVLLPCASRKPAPPAPRPSHSRKPRGKLRAGAIVAIVLGSIGGGIVLSVFGILAYKRITGGRSGVDYSPSMGYVEIVDY